jgi:hypothetical protein
MACVQSTPFRINHEWAASLRGFRMKVPDDWWPGYLSHALNSGVIACVDLDIDKNNHFQLKLDKECGVFYTMCYNAVILMPTKRIAPSLCFACPLMLSAIQQTRLL